jgi:LacI family transcriptional regulator, repressor for deo operon, udp, cdd, tsx, nupC, and nupG
VSRVLNNSIHVSENTRKTVMMAINELDYNPNFLGRNLRTQKTKMILVILNNLSNDFFSKVIKGIETSGSIYNYNIMIATTYGNKKKEEAYLDLLINKQVDGAIFMSSTVTSEKLEILGQKHNIIQCSEYVENVNIPYVTIDNYAASYEATNYLIESGCKKIIYMTVNNNYMSTKLRLSGFKQAMFDHNLQIHPKMILMCDYGFKKSYDSMQEVLNTKNIPDSVFAISDRMAAGAIKCILKNKYSVPNDISVIGFDNISLTSIYNPTITTVSQSSYKMGCIACSHLIDKINGKSVELTTVLSHELIIRESTR